MWRCYMPDETIPPQVAAIIDTFESDEEGDCMMLIEGKNMAGCLIEIFLGKEAKPKVCQDYPEDGERCENDKEGR